MDAHALQIVSDDGTATRVEEHHLRRGGWLLRSGHRTPDGPAGATRRRLLDAWLRTIEPLDVPATWEPDLPALPDGQDPAFVVLLRSRRLSWRGEPREADALLHELLDRPDADAVIVIAHRLQVRERHPDLSWPDDPAWLVARLPTLSVDHEYAQSQILAYLADRGACTAVLDHARRLEDAAPRILPAGQREIRRCSGVASPRPMFE
jgi:hypothetical protein